MDPAAVAAARAKLAAKMGGNSAKIGGKGTQRRPPAKQHKSLAVVDDKKLQVVLKKLSVNAITSVEEVTLFKTDGSSTYFSSPKFQANTEANTYVVSGSAEERKAPPGMGDFAKLAKQLGGRMPPGFSAEDLMRMQQAMAAGGVGGADEDMPDLEGVSFDAAGEKGEAGDAEEMPALESK